MAADRHPRAHVAGDRGRTLGRAHDQLHVAHAFDLKIHAGEAKGVAGPQRGAEGLLHPAERAPVPEAHVEHLGIDDDPGVDPEARRLLGVRQPPEPVPALHDAAETIIGAQRIAPGRDELEHARESPGIDHCIGQRRAQFRQQRRLVERAGAGAGHDVLRQDVEPARTEGLAIALALVDRIDRRHRLQELEAVARHDQRLARAVEPMIGAADALEQARRALGGAHLHDEVDVAPVDPEIEAGGRHQRAQLAARHRAFDLAPRLPRQRAVVDADRQLVVVGLPQELEDVLSQEARVGEDQRGAVGADLRVELRHRPSGGVAAPGHALVAERQHDRDMRRRAGFALDQRDAVEIAPGREPGAEVVGLRHGG